MASGGGGSKGSETVPPWKRELMQRKSALARYSSTRIQILDVIPPPTQIIKPQGSKTQVQSHSKEKGHQSEVIKGVSTLKILLRIFSQMK